MHAQVAGAFDGGEVAGFVYLSMRSKKSSNKAKPPGLPVGTCKLLRFTPYKNAWLQKVNDFYLKSYPVG